MSTQARHRPWFVLVALALVATVLTVAPSTPRAAAQAGSNWVCDGTPILMRGGKLHRIVPDPGAPGELTIDTIAGTSGIWNSTGYDPTTDLLYGVGKVGGIKQVRAYDASGATVFQTAIQAPYPMNAGTYAGTVMGDGRYVVHSVGSGNGNGWYDGSRFNLWSIDPVTGASTHIGSTPVNFADFAYNPRDGYLYQVVNRVLYKVDPNNGSVTSTPMPGTYPNGSFGASWFDAAGFLYQFRNNPGDIFKIDVEDTSTWVEVGEVGADGGTDAASCVSQIDLKKDVVNNADTPIPPQNRTFMPGTVITHEFTVINNGLPTQNLTVRICDTLPADGRTFTGAWSASTTATVVSGLANGDTSFCLDVEAPSSLWTDPANAGADPATVTVDVRLGNAMVPGVYENQATLDIDRDGTPEVMSDDPGDDTDPRDPTTIEVRTGFTIDKTVVGHPIDNAADSFGVALACTVGGAPFSVPASWIRNAADNSAWPGATANSLSISHGDSVLVRNMPGGAECSVTEAANAAYATTPFSSDGTSAGSTATLVLDETRDDEAVAFTNRTGSLSIAKQAIVTNPLHSNEGSFDVRLVCSDGTDQTHTLTTVDGSASATFPALPLLADGTDCTVSELVPAGWTLNSPNDQTVTIASGSVPAVGFVNERQAAPLVITKEILGLPGGADPTAWEFDVAVTCTGGYTTDPHVVPGPLTISTDSPILVTDVPVGSVCTVTEAPEPGFNATYGPANPVIIADGGSTVEITNRTGSLIIEKRATAAQTHPINPVETFDFDLVCTDAGANEVHNATHSITTAALTDTGATGGVSWSDIGVLPPGTTCTATELAPPAGWALTAPAGGTATVVITAADPEPTAVFENTRATGSLTVEKTLVGVPAALDLDDEIFTVDVSCSGGFTSATHVISDQPVSVNTPLVIDDLPTGSVCTVDEQPDPRFAAAVAPAEVTIDADGELVTLTNETASFALAKTTFGANPDLEDVDGTFDFVIACSTAGGDPLGSSTVTISTTDGVGAAPAASLPLVPPGSTCTVEEDVPAGWTITDRTGGTLSGPAGVVVAVGPAAAVSFENTLDLAALTITKDVVGAGVTAAVEAEDFDVVVSCTGNFAGGTWTSPTLQVSEASPLVIDDLPIGSSCTVTEAIDPRFTQTLSPGASVVVNEAGAAVAIENATSTFTITKATNVPVDVDPDATFTFDVTCTFAGAEVHTETVAITTAGGTGSWGPPNSPHLPPGTECVVVENPPAAWNAVGTASVTVTTAEDAVVDAAFTNARSTASLTITKTLLGIPDGFDFDDEPFTVDVSCTGDVAPNPLVINDLVVTRNAPVSVPNLPTGALCTVTEDFDSRFQTLYSPDIGDGTAAQVTIDADGTEAGITNAGGTLAIHKDTVAPDTHPIDLLESFTFDLDCGAAHSGTYVVDVDQLSGGQGIGGLTYTSLPIMPLGTNCTITETVPPGWELAPAGPQVVTIQTDPPTAHFINTRQTASLTIEKVIAGLPAGFDLDDETFVVDVSCSGGFTVDPYVLADLTLSVASPIVIDDLPVGTECTLTEDADPRFDRAVSAPTTLAVGGSTMTATNTTSSVSISKTTSAPTTHPVEDDGTFSFSVDCGLGWVEVVSLTTVDGSATWAAPDTPLVPPGTTCVVTENDPGSGWSNDGAASITVTTDGLGVSSLVPFSNTREVAPFTVGKSVTGAPVDLSDEEFTITISCTGGFTTEPYVLGPFTLTENAPVDVVDLPVGATCAVAEDPDPRFTPLYSPNQASEVIVPGGSQLDIDNRTGTFFLRKEVVASGGQPILLTQTFTIEVDCTDGTNMDIPLTVTAGAPATVGWPDVPLFPDGTACVLTEKDLPAGWTLLGENGFETIVRATQTETHVFENERDTANLTVTKAVVGAPDGLDPADLTFTVDISCAGDFESSPLTFLDQPIGDAGSIVIERLPTGAVCTVVEDADARFATSYSPATAATTGIEIVDGGSTVSIVNSTGEVMIVKTTQTTSDHPVDVTESFDFTVDCGAAHSATHTVDADDSISATSATGFLRYSDLPALPEGTDCTVTEQAAPAGWTLVSPASVDLTVDAAGVATAAFTNRRDTGVLTVTKTLVGVPTGTDLDDEPFIIDVTCVGGFDGGDHALEDLTLTVNDPVVVDGLPVGTECTVTEDSDPRFTSAIDDAVVIDADGESIEVTNTTSTLAITKQATAPGPHPIDVDLPFTFDVDCGALFDAEIIVTTTAGTGTWTSPDTPLLPPGTACTVTEQTVDRWTLSTANDQTITTTATAPATATFVNERQTGALTVTKTLIGVPDAFDLGDEAFLVDITCVGDFVGGTHALTNRTVSANTPLVISDLPTGANCSVVEAADARFEATVSAPVEVDADGETIEVTNRTSTIAITKFVTSDSPHPVELDETFAFDVDCGALFSGTISITTTDGAGSWAAPDTPLLPPGSSCTVTEQTPPTGWEVDGAQTETLVTVANDIASADIRNTRTTASLTIEKLLDGVPDGTDFTSREFEVTATCTGGFIGDATHVITGQVTSVEPLVFTGLPTDTQCRVEETPDPSFRTTYVPDDGADGPPTITVPDGGAAATIINSTGAFIILKEAIAPTTHPIITEADFSFDIDCGAAWTGSRTLTTDTPTGAGSFGGILWTDLPLLPDGTSCVITEADPGPLWNATTGPVTITVSADAPVTARFDNIRRTGEVAIQKLLEVPDGYELSDEPFVVRAECSGDLVGGSVMVEGTVTANTPLVISDLPTASECVLAEEPDERFSSTWDVDTVSISDVPAAVQLTNAAGVLTVDTELLAHSSDLVSRDATITYSVVCLDPEDAVVFDQIVDTTTVGGTSPTATTPLIPAGARCTVTQTDAASWGLQSRTGGAPEGDVGLAVSIEPQVQSLAFVNVRLFDGLTIHKVLEDVPGSLDHSATEFDFLASCADAPTGDTFVLTGTATSLTPLRFDGLPVGARCAVSEATDDRFVPRWDAGNEIDIGPNGSTLTVVNVASEALKNSGDPGILAFTGSSMDQLFLIAMLLIAGGALLRFGLGRGREPEETSPTG